VGVRDCVTSAVPVPEMLGVNVFVIVLVAVPVLDSVLAAVRDTEPVRVPLTEAVTDGVPVSV